MLMIDELLDDMAIEIERLMVSDAVKARLRLQLAELADNTQELRLKALFDCILFEAKKLNT